MRGIFEDNQYPFGGLFPINIPAVLSGVGKKLRDRMYRTVKPESYSREQLENFIIGKSREAYRDPNSEALLGKYTGQDSIIADYTQAPDGLPIGRVLTQAEIDSLGANNNTLAKYAVNDIIVPSKSKQGAFEFAHPNQSGNAPHLPYNYNDIPSSRWTHSKQLGSYEQSKEKEGDRYSITYKDVWDINPFRGKSSSDDPSWRGFIEAGKAVGLDKLGDIVPFGKPFDIHGKRYYDKNGKPIKSKAEGGFIYQPRDAWDSLSMTGKSEMMKVAVKNGITDLKTIREKYNEFAEGGDINEERPAIIPFGQKTEVIITPDSEYNQYLNTLPDNQRFTPNDKYDSYLYWKLHGKPKNFEEAYNRNMFHYDNSDSTYHANSIAWGNDGVGYFMKPKTHDTVGYELDWFNKGLVTEEGGHQRSETPDEKLEADEFRKNYMLIDDPVRTNYYRYQPIERAKGGKIYIKPENRGKFTALKERTGHSASWFKEHGTPAQKKMATFALNSRHWKHGLGGNLFDGTSEDTQQMQIGRPYYSYDWNGNRMTDANGNPILIDYKR